jgi:Domain of unknown function (DUF4158)
MSTSFLTAAERERWQRFPETIPQDDLAVYFLLSDDDTREVNRQREPFNRLGYALQLCALRYLGFGVSILGGTPCSLNDLPRGPDDAAWAWATRQSVTTRSRTDRETTA